MDEKNVKIKVTPEIDLSYYEKQIIEIEQKNKELEKNIAETSSKLQVKLDALQKKGLRDFQAAQQLKYDDDSRELFRLKEEKAANDKFLKSMRSAQNSKGYSAIRADAGMYSRVLGLQDKEKNGNALTTEDRKILSDFGSSVLLIKNAIDTFTKAAQQTERNITARATQESLKKYNNELDVKAKDIPTGKIPVRKRNQSPQQNKNYIDTNNIVTYLQALSYPKGSKERSAAERVQELTSTKEQFESGRVFTPHRKNELFWGELFKDRMVYNAAKPKDKSKATIRQTPYGTFAPNGKDPITGSYLTPDGYLMPSPSLKIVDHNLDILGQIGYGRMQENTSLQYDGSGGTSLFNLEQIYEDLEKRQLSLNKKDPQYKEQLQAIEQVKNSIIQSVLDAINNYERSDNLTSLGDILKGKFTAVEAGEKRTSTKFKDTSSLANMVRYKLRGNQPSDFEATGFFNAEDMITREGEGSTQVDRYDRKKQDEEFRRQDDSEREKIAAQEQETNEALENLNKALGLSVDGVGTWLQNLLSTSGAESVTQAANEILSQASDVLRGIKADSEGNVSLESSFSSLGYDNTGNSGRSGLITSFNYNELEDEANRNNELEDEANRNDVEQETLLEKEKDRIAQMEDSFQTEEELLNEAQKSLKTYNDFLEAIETQIREMQNNLDPSKIEERAILGQYADQLLSRRTNIKNPFNKTLEQNQQEGANRFARFIMQSSAYDKSWQSYADDTGLSFEQVKERALNAMPDSQRENFEIDYEDSKKAAQVFFDTLQGDWQNLEKAINATFGTITSSKGELAEIYSQFKSIASGEDLKQGFLDLVQNQLDPTSRRSLNRYNPDERVSIKYPVTDNSLTAANIKEQDILFRKGVSVYAPYGVIGPRVDDKEVGDATFKGVTSTFDQAIEVIDRRLEEIDNAEQKYQETSEKVAQSIETISDIEKKYGVKETKSGKKITWSEGEYSKEEISSDKYRYQKAKKDVAKSPIAPKPLESERERLLRDRQALQEASFSTKLAYANVEPKNDINIPKVTNQEQKKQDIQETNKELEQQKQLETEIKAIEEQQTNQQEKEPLYDLSILQKRYDELKAKPDDNDLTPQGENVNITSALRTEDADIDEVNNSFSKHIELVQQATQVEQEKQNASAQLTAQLQEELHALQKLNEEFDVHNGNAVRTKGGGMFTFGDFITSESTQNLNSQDYEDYELREKEREQRTHAATNQAELIRRSGDKGFSGGKSPEQLIRDTREVSSLSKYPQDWRGAVRQYQKEVENIVKATLAINKNMEEQKILEEQIKEIKASGVDENNSLLLKLEQELAKRKQNLAIAKEQYEAAQIARDETGVADMANATNSMSFTDDFARQVKQIDANAEISLREQLASSDTKAETLGIVTNFKREQADIKQADIYLKQYIQNLKQKATIEADIRRTDAKASGLTGREAFEAQQVRAALEKQRKLVESQAPVYENDTLNGVKLTQEQINKLNEEKAKIEAKSEVTQARITKTYSSQVGILKTISNTFRNSFGQLVGMNVIANKLANSVSQVFTNAIANTKALNKNMVDLQIASGASYSDIKNMMLDFNELAKKVGKSTQEVAVAANDWLRAGYEGEDAAKLVESSMQLSVLGMIESSQATEYLISVMKGWKLEVSEVSSIVDKLSAVDMAAAISAGDLATAMQRSSVSAQIAGSTLDRYIGMLTVVAETTQKTPETVDILAA